MEAHYPFTLPPLPYGYDALLPEIGERTLHFHHDKHFQTYIDNLNKLLETHPEVQDWPLERLVQEWPRLPEDIRQGVRNNAGGVYNHDLYFKTLAPGPASSPMGPLAAAAGPGGGGSPGPVRQHWPFRAPRGGRKPRHRLRPLRREGLPGLLPV